MSRIFTFLILIISVNAGAAEAGAGGPNSSAGTASADAAGTYEIINQFGSSLTGDESPAKAAAPAPAGLSQPFALKNDPNLGTLYIDETGLLWTAPLQKNQSYAEALETCKQFSQAHNVNAHLPFPNDFKILANGYRYNPYTSAGTPVMPGIAHHAIWVAETQYDKSSHFTGKDLEAKAPTDTADVRCVYRPSTIHHKT